MVGGGVVPAGLQKALTVNVVMWWEDLEEAAFERLGCDIIKSHN
jgi:hypothetical protein